MSIEPISEDQSHYEVSLTAGQAFFAFVLLLLSLAASFAFGLMIGRTQGDDHLLAQNAPAIVDEAGAIPKQSRERIVELGVSEDAAFRGAEEKPAVRQPARTQSKPAPPPIKIREEPPPAAAPAVPHYAQLLSTTDQKRAEAFAAKLIDGGFLSAYVERASNEKGPLFRVRINFPSEEAARAAETKLRTFGTDVWIARQ
ncbi:MAG TPA: SPOR domain-containing protein [Thermoanaerobaculia bacterium]|nr:SPOR domain-containing protein [Thermoanaerobaculia bacterium]